jgi:hypothetical protein
MANDREIVPKEIAGANLGDVSASFQIIGQASFKTLEGALDCRRADHGNVHLRAKVRRGILSGGFPTVTRKQCAASLNELVRFRTLHVAGVWIVEGDDLRDDARLTLEHLDDTHARRESWVYVVVGLVLAMKIHAQADLCAVDQRVEHLPTVMTGWKTAAYTYNGDSLRH